MSIKITRARYSYKQRVRFAIARLADGLVGLLTGGFFMSNFASEHARKAARDYLTSYRR